VDYVAATASFRCSFCRYEWAEQTLDAAMGLSHGIAELEGTVLSTAATDIETSESLITLKCTGCGAEVVVNTDNTLQARCHWCRHQLSLNDRLPNGAVPDGILPFAITREQAWAAISRFAGERSSFQHPAFRASFRPENIMGVYMPYMTVDGNFSVRLDGLGEVLTRVVRRSKAPSTYYANEFSVVRTLNVHVDDLVVETSSSRADITSQQSTNNIINAVLPFDVKNMVRFNANFLSTAFTSERRDMDVSQAESYAVRHFLSIARNAVKHSISGYNRGVRWTAEQVNVKGTRWTSVLLPVWLYSFVENDGGQAVTHYIAVNGRTGHVMGSIPMNKGKAKAAAWAIGVGISVITWPIVFGVIVLLALGS
jgi:hypothetical protein